MATLTDIGANPLPPQADTELAPDVHVASWKKGPWSSHPWMELYFLWAILSLVPLFPYWCLVYLPRSNRPRKTWSLKETVLVMTEHRLQWLIAQTRIPMPVKDPFKLPKPSKLKGECTVEWLPPAPESLIKGFLSSDYAKPVRIPMYVYPEQTMKEVGFGEKGLVALFMHGGGYFLLSAAPNFTPAAISRNLVKMPGIHAVLAVEYRLSCFNPAPGALIDCLSAYVHAVDKLRISPDRIVLVGDSAGGALAMALLRYLRDETEYALPRACMLLSPSCDAASWDRESVAKARERIGPVISDYLNRTAMSPLYRAALAGNRSPKEEYALFNNAYFSPANIQFKGKPEMFQKFPKTLITWGTAEVLAEEIERLSDGLKLSGVETTSHTIEDGVHDCLTVSWWNKDVKQRFWRDVAFPWFQALTTPA